MVTQPPPGEPIPVLNNSFCKEFFPDIQPKPPLVQLEAISPRPLQWEETKKTLSHYKHLSDIIFQILEESNKVSPQPPFPQTEQPQFLQSLLVGHILQALHKPCCPSLDLLQHLKVLASPCQPLNEIWLHPFWSLRYTACTWAPLGWPCLPTRYSVTGSSCDSISTTIRNFCNLPSVFYRLQNQNWFKSIKKIIKRI